MIPGAGPSREVVEKTTEVVAKQEWEDEGGAPKVVPPAKTKGAPKLLSKKAKPKAKKAAPKARKAAPTARAKPKKSAAKSGTKRVRARR
jgi:hypothetical protein